MSWVSGHQFDSVAPKLQICNSPVLKMVWRGTGELQFCQKKYSLLRKVVFFSAHSLYLISPSIKLIMSAQNTIRVICLQDNETNINIFFNTECEYFKIKIIKFCQCIIHYSILLLLSPRIWVWTLTLKVVWNYPKGLFWKRMILKVDKEFSTFGYYLLFQRNVVFHLIENDWFSSLKDVRCGSTLVF